MPRPPYVSVHVRSKAPGRRLAAEDLVAALAEEIKAGRLPPGCRLPPVRALERQLGLSKNTVQVAYDELAARGLLDARPREGVYVTSPAEPEAAAGGASPEVPLPRLRPAPALFGRPVGGDAIPLSTVLIDPALLPRERLAECFRSVLRQPGLQALSDFPGYGPLREIIAARLRRRGMEVEPDEVIVTVGSQQAIDVVARALEIRRVAVEDPVYPHARILLAGHGLALQGLPLDPFTGIDLDLWERRIEEHRPGLMYAITSFQNPTGYSYSTHELLRVLEIAERRELALFEDDWGSEMLSDSEYRPGLRLLGGRNVLYVNSFTKKLLPAIRIGFVVAPRALVPALVAQKRLSTLGGPSLVEAALAEFLDRGYYETHLAALQRALDHRYARCLELLRSLMPDDVRWTTPGGGPTLWLEIPRRVDLPNLAARLLRRGVQIEDPTAAFAGVPHLHGFRISYAYLGEEPLARALEAVGDELRALL
jgi:DNA-binding transcriptional MocR family regulator